MELSFFDELDQRGLIAQSTNPALLREFLAQPQTVYCGFDPTAGSLHIGHLVPLLMLKRFADAGHNSIALIGGATGMIGDPSFKAAERSLNTADTVVHWANQLTEQIARLMTPHLDQPLTLVNNAHWMAGMSAIDFFRDVGKHFSVNNMIRRESVRQRLERPDQGISFTEFSYALLQSYDFCMLNKQFGCRLQIGGNDQWGNIVSGIDLTRRLNNEKVEGLTLPLISKADGTKFGKTESGTVWLDAEKTSPYSFYQFWLNVDDKDVYRLLGYYSFLSMADINAIEQRDLSSNSKPIAQQILAEQVTRFVHGDAGLESAQRITRALFSGGVGQLTHAEFQQLALDGLPCMIVNKQQTLAEVLVDSALAKSCGNARELLRANAIRVNGEICAEGALAEHFAIYDQFWILQRGQKQFCLLQAVA
ncbi:MAG: tyrosine--tRNA ligase [Cellvibrio sp.]|uniref:tyrosine--tRNA ligase n=1 Tax=Cellvibrio sp. TaxID=1965322 RepID=UPI0031A67B2E